MSNANIPTIDVSPLFGTNCQEKMKVAKQIDEACRDTGFFFAKNHQVNMLEEFFNTVDYFHQNITNDERWEMAIAAYKPENKEHVLTGFYLPITDKKTVQSFYLQNPNFSNDHPLIKAKTPLHEINVWPDPEKYPGFRNVIEKYYWKAFQFSQILLRGFALALSKPENFFDQFFNYDDTMSSMRLIRYPHIDPYPSGAIKTARDGTLLSFETHTDVSLLTVLYQPCVANLQVETPEGYKNIDSSDDCYLVNGGLFLELITNGYYKAPLHRVIYVNKERLSLPFFVHLAYNSVVESFLPHGQENGNKDHSHKAYQYGQFFMNERLELIKKNGQT